MSRAVRALFAFALTGVACGARTGLAPDELVAAGEPDGAAPACSVAPLCADATRGTWRLTARGEPAGYLFTFDGQTGCNGSSTSFLLVLTDVAGAARSCSRNGDYAIVADAPTSFAFVADNLGGNFGPPCGGEPADETMRLELTRSSCEAARYDLVVHDSAPGSVYERTLVATRCRCDIGWAACQEALPDDPCDP